MVKSFITGEAKLLNFRVQAGGISALPSFIAAGLSSGHCKLLRTRLRKIL